MFKRPWYDCLIQRGICNHCDDRHNNGDIVPTSFISPPSFLSSCLLHFLLHTSFIPTPSFPSFLYPYFHSPVSFLPISLISLHSFPLSLYLSFSTFLPHIFFISTPYVPSTPISFISPSSLSSSYLLHFH